jgi:hypothetical protein
VNGSAGGSVSGSAGGSAGGSVSGSPRALAAEPLPLLTSHSRWTRLAQAWGERFAPCRFDNFVVYHDDQTAVLTAMQRFAASVRQRVDRGDNLLLYGSAGTGKDHLLASMVRRAVMLDGVPVDWVCGASVWDAFRWAKSPEAFRNWRRRWIRPAVLAVSDLLPADTDLLPEERRALLSVVDARYRRRRPTWATVSVGDDAAAIERLGVCLLDRFRDAGLVLTLRWPSFRARRMNEQAGIGLESTPGDPHSRAD